ncbi:peptidase [Streptomyces sp. SBST2-5]|uniref:Peptidase n=1 Tax=Streptomyces composti TaxID=2720025 RepID=A0ABX1AAR6_9ACTN|nr:Clp protease N-terminal domain-containing protein [Streptomyces composti]NJP53584.1 peptidase [Streptomyces composti]
MFERFTKDARAVVKGAVAQAASVGAASVTPEHLLLGLLESEGSRGSFALAALGGGEWKDAVRGELEAARRRGGLTQAEAEALAGLGIDVDEVVARVEDVHGVGALSGGQRGRRGHVPFGKGAKDVLQRTLRIALAQRERRIGDEHILLALTGRPGVPAEVLAGHGVTYESVSRVLYGSGEAKAG